MTSLSRSLPNVLIGLISAVMAALGGIVSGLPPVNSRERIAYTLTFVVLACCAVMVTIWQSRRGMKFEAEMQEQVIGLKATISQLQSEVAEQGRINAELAEESIGAVMGGDSFCWMQVNHQFGYPTPVFVHSGKHTLYDVDIRITDLQKLRSGIQPSDVALKVPELHPGRAYLNPQARLPFSGDQQQDFNVFFSARNGMWVEKLRLRKKEGEWASACQVWITNPTAAPKEPVFEEISAGYPRSEGGTVDWGV